MSGAKAQEYDPFLAGEQPLGSNVPWVDEECMISVGLLLVSLQEK